MVRMGRILRISCSCSTLHHPGYTNSQAIPLVLPHHAAAAPCTSTPQPYTSQSLPPLAPHPPLPPLTSAGWWGAVAPPPPPAPLTSSCCWLP
jgi:hypothetical protein